MKKIVVAILITIIAGFAAPVFTGAAAAKDLPERPFAPASELAGASSTEKKSSVEKISTRALNLMKALNVAGAVVIVVENGAPSYEAALGYADIDNKIAFSFDKTIFPAGSLSKVITAMAVLKLSEAGRLELDAPAADIFNAAGLLSPLKCLAGLNIDKKVTSLSLLTHSSGFENRAVPFYSDAGDNGSPPPFIAEFAAKNHSAFNAKKAGVSFQYANFNYALLGSLIENAAGIRYNEYVKSVIFSPLEMNYSSFDPFDLYKNLASGGFEYNIASSPAGGGSNSRVPAVKRHNMPSASGFLTCGADMSKLTIELISLSSVSSASSASGGRKSSKIFKDPAAASLLFKKLVSVNKKDAPLIDKFPPFDYMAAGFRRSLYNSREIFWHTGGLRGYSCGLYVIPQSSSAYFIAYNSSDSALRQKLIKFLFDNY